MLYQKPYHHPYIPRSSKLAPEPPYVGGELASLTSNTPFYRSQGIPIYTNTAVVRHTNFGGVNYGSPITVGLKRRNEGKAVEALQEKLKALGYDIGEYGADGDFYKDTEKALKKYQKDQGLAQTGEVDQATYNRLMGIEDADMEITVTGEKVKKGDGSIKSSIAGGIANLFQGFQTGLGQGGGQGSGGGGITIATYQQGGMSGTAKALIGIGGALALFGMVYLVAKD